MAVFLSVAGTYVFSEAVVRMGLIGMMRWRSTLANGSGVDRIDYSRAESTPGLIHVDLPLSFGGHDQSTFLTAESVK
jgi:hypothetical protein